MLPTLRPNALTKRLAGRLLPGLFRVPERPQVAVPAARRTGAAAALALLALSPGCAGSHWGARQTLHVVVVPTERMEWLRNDYLRDSQALEPLLSAFRRLQPNVDIQITLESQASVQQTLRNSSSRGLGPDLLLLRSPQAVSLLEEGLIDPLPQRDPSFGRVLRMITPFDLNRVRTPQGIAGLPVFTEFTLACYDRRRLQQPPTTVAELLAVAASGGSVGLAVEPTGIWWTAGALGAQEVMTPILVGNADSSARTTADKRRALIGWLAWLRQAALQSRVEITSGPQELTLGLESGQFVWVPCFSPSLIRLDRTLGRHLGVAPLPSGPGGPATPFSTPRVWSLGRDSTPEQRRLALQLAALSLDPLPQRQMMLMSHSVLPANRYVPVPVASSGRLAALATAKEQFQQSSAVLTGAFSLDRLLEVMPTVEALITNVMVGVTTPQQGADALLRLRPQAKRAR